MIIAFYKSTHVGLPGLYNRLVRVITNSPYSHCELIFTDGRSASASYMDGGIRFKNICYDPYHWDFIDVPGHLEQAALEWFTSHEDQGYDLLGNINFIAWMVPQDKRKWFCSEAVGAALGITDAWRYSPATLYSALKLLIKHQ